MKAPHLEGLYYYYALKYIPFIWIISEMSDKLFDCTTIFMP